MDDDETDRAEGVGALVAEPRRTSTRRVVS